MSWDGDASWRHAAVYWTVLWPAWVATLAGLWIALYIHPGTDRFALAWITWPVSCFVQVLLIPRILKKRFRGFIVEAQRPGEPPSRSLHPREYFQIALRLTLLLVLFAVASAVADAALVRSRSPLSPLLLHPLFLWSWGGSILLEKAYRGFALSLREEPNV